MFISELISVVMNEKEEITIKGETYKLSKIVYKECKLLYHLYSMFIGVATVFGYLIGMSLGVDNYFLLLLIIIFFLVILAIVYNYLAQYLIERRIKNGL